MLRRWSAFVTGACRHTRTGGLTDRVVHATARGQGCSTVGAAWRLHRIAALVELRSHTSPSCCADELLCPVRARHRDGEDGNVDREPEHEMYVPERDEQHRRQQSGLDGVMTLM